MITPTERQVLRLLSQRKTPAEIARSVGLGAAEFDPYLATLFSKLGVASSTEAIGVASKRGLLTNCAAELVDAGG